MALRREQRVVRLRRAAQQLARTLESPERDALLARIRSRVVELEATEELGPPTSMPALRNEPVGRRLPPRRR